MTDRALRWRAACRTVLCGWILFTCSPTLSGASPVSPSAWQDTTWQGRCQGVRTSYNPAQELSDDALMLTPTDARWLSFLSWVQKNRVSEHHIEGINTGGSEAQRGITVHWAPHTRWERQTRMSVGYAIAYLVGALGWQDSDFPEFFARRGGTYGINLKDRLVLVDALSASPWQDFFRFLTTLPLEAVTLARLTAVDPEQRTVTITAGLGRTRAVAYEQFASLLGQVLTDCRAYEFFQAYDRQDAGLPAGQAPGTGLAPQRTAAMPAAARSARSSLTAIKSPVQGDAEPTGLSQGRTLYEQECSVCHGVEGDGKGPLATALFPRPRNFTMGLFRYRSTATGQLPTDQDLYRSISRGLPGTAMPAWGQFFRREEIEGVIAYLKHFSERFAKEGPGEVVTVPPPPAVTPEGLVRGRQLYTDMGCASCHGDDGKGQGGAGEGLNTAEGDPIAPRDLTDKWSFRGGHTPEDVFRVLATGLDGSPMPSYRGMVADEELWDLVFYVLSLSPADRPRVTVHTALQQKGQ